MFPKDESFFCGEPNCEEYWIECVVCGCEFCTKCFPNSTLCPDCAEEAEQEGLEDDPDFEDVPDLDAVMNDHPLGTPRPDDE